MNSSKQSVQFPWFGVSLLGIWLFSLGLRFWGLGRFNTLVFDEVYYAKFAHNYLSQTPFFDGHPPLSKYIIAVGMWLGERMPFGQTEKNGLTGGLYAPWTYRWLNALMGSLIPLVVAGIAYQLLRRRTYAAIAALLAAWDGIFLVESRYALNNVHLVLFGLMGWWFLLLALDCGQHRDVAPQQTMVYRAGWLVLAGISFGASIAIKWNGLWFLLGAYGVWMLAQGWHWLAHHTQEPVDEAQPELTRTRSHAGRYSPLQKLPQLHGWQWGLYLGIIPFVTYGLIWIPHLHQNLKQGYWEDFWALQSEILSYHNRVGSGPEVHPYCSSWYSWLIMWRPVAYFYKVTGRGDPIPTEQVLPPTTTDQVIYDVHAIGNPVLWWFSTLAIAVVIGLAIGLVGQQVRKRWQQRPYQADAIAEQWGLTPAEQWLVLFLTVNYLANLLPWVRVTRCTFLYHYMGALVFASLALAWLLDRWLWSDREYLRNTSIAVLIMLGIAFVFWMPIYLGLPITPEVFKKLMWLPSWI